MPFLAVLFLWLAQPPLGLFIVACFALVPLLWIIEGSGDLKPRDYFVIWCAGLAYWLLSLQGLRHAHPAMYACWIALSAYLACYLALFVLIVRRLTVHGLPLWVSAPFVWVGLECIRNYLLTGISAAMLGHTLANVPVMIQIADLAGTYGISFVLVSINVAIVLLGRVYRREETYVTVRIPLGVTGALVGATIAYGVFRLNQAPDESEGNRLATFALIQRDEPVTYEQDVDREVEIAERYAQQTVSAAQQAKAANQTIDAVAWPESMFTSGVPWYFAEDNLRIPSTIPLSEPEFHAMIAQGQEEFLRRAFMVQEAVRVTGESESQPHLILGTAVFRYAERPYIYSGVAHVQPSEKAGERFKRPVMAQWYAKTHRVLFGEYVPLASLFRRVGIMLPHVDAGPGPRLMMIGDTGVAPNICIETAVERVTLNHLATLRQRNEKADVVVTVTNDGWFDDSSVLEHHLRCTQLVAVGARRPILSAANNGPTAWIDSCGRIVRRIPSGTNGSIIASPRRDERSSLYLRIGDWPARLAALLCVLAMMELVYHWWQRRSEHPDQDAAPNAAVESSRL